MGIPQVRDRQGVYARKEHKDRHKHILGNLSNLGKIPGSPGRALRDVLRRFFCWVDPGPQTFFLRFVSPFVHVFGVNRTHFFQNPIPSTLLSSSPLFAKKNSGQNLEQYTNRFDIPQTYMLKKSIREDTKKPWPCDQGYLIFFVR